MRNANLRPLIRPATLDLLLRWLIGISIGLSAATVAVAIYTCVHPLYHDQAQVPARPAF